MTWTVLGVDCATDPRRTGLARAEFTPDGKLRIVEAELGRAEPRPGVRVADWLIGVDRHIVALDAPLGWPARLGPTLSQHRAGAAIEPDANALFRRATDREVQLRLGKRPLEVGADLIARTARAALELLDEARHHCGHPLAMCWEPGEACGALEVYPAATVMARGLSTKGTKAANAQGRRARADLLEALQDEWQLDVAEGPLIDSDHLLDACLCALAGADFLRGECVPPADRDLAEVESWIWFREPRRD